MEMRRYNDNFRACIVMEIDTFKLTHWIRFIYRIDFMWGELLLSLLFFDVQYWLYFEVII